MQELIAYGVYSIFFFIAFIIAAVVSSDRKWHYEAAGAAAVSRPISVSLLWPLLAESVMYPAVWHPFICPSLCLSVCPIGIFAVTLQWAQRPALILVPTIRTTDILVSFNFFWSHFDRSL